MDETIARAVEQAQMRAKLIREAAIVRAEAAEMYGRQELIEQ